MPVENVPTIVIVDDEEMVLTSLNSFLGLETDYSVKTFTSPKNALGFISENDLDLIVSDFLMPEMNGIAFLTQAREIRPEVPRIILTGYADKENAIKGVNEAKLFHYVEKPWNNDDLLIILRNAIEQSQLKKRIRETIAEVALAQNELVGLQKDVFELLGR